MLFILYGVGTVPLQLRSPPVTGFTTATVWAIVLHWTLGVPSNFFICHQHCGTVEMRLGRTATDTRPPASSLTWWWSVGGWLGWSWAWAAPTRMGT